MSDVFAPAAPPQNLAPATPVRIDGNADTKATNAYGGGPEDRFADMQRRQAAADPWVNPDVVLVRDPKTGAIVPHEKIVGADGVPKAGKPIAAGPADPNADPAATDPAAADTGQKYQIGKHEITETQLEKMLERQGAEDLKKATLPPTANDYKLEISEGATLPGGASFQFKADDPGLMAARNWAHARGLSQGEFSELLTIYAGHVAQQDANMRAAQAAEVAKAGVNVGQRIDSVATFVKSQMGSKDAGMIMRALVSDAQLRFYEKMITRFTNQSGGNYSGGRREVEPRGPSEEQWAKMSYTERKDYAEKSSAARSGRR